ncbi:hypothetical protein PENARI_c055G04452 [Penicillium arizonense]|uniref:Uncharacterized protein n=1 Tax=Penicillium arizonense TaxID=1835702 RepID=A0A1F5L1Y0_PENAI|nr:hypothetical protein PENARI_c055G04452 [Penicillium arizonense]OGE47202.1 hypothetical protein PENARI_c055G04452 [Penicillium arizonense]
MDLHCLDTAAARFMLARLFLVYRGQIDLDRVRHAFHLLLTSWPILHTKVNLLRTSLNPVHDPEHDSVPFHFRTIDTKLSDYITEPLGTGELSSQRWKALHDLLRFPNSLSSLVFSPALVVKAVQLQDACLVELVFQHGLCDASAE